MDSKEVSQLKSRIYAYEAAYYGFTPTRSFTVLSAKVELGNEFKKYKINIRIVKGFENLSRYCSVVEFTAWDSAYYKNRKFFLLDKQVQSKTC